jgi:hypothetical protein
MYVVLFTPASPTTSRPIQTFPLPVISLPAESPNAVLELPSTLAASEITPTAVLKLPSVLLRSALEPIAVFCTPTVLLASVRCPIAVLSWPRVAS